MWSTARTSCGAGRPLAAYHGQSRYFYWYIIKEVYSRKLVANEVHESESAEQAAQPLRQAYQREQRPASRWYCIGITAER